MSLWVLDTDMLTLWFRGQGTIDLPGIRRYRQLRTHHRRIGANDLRIAAIVLEQHGILVTRKTNDFAAIPGLQLDDWL